MGEIPWRFKSSRPHWFPRGQSGPRATIPKGAFVPYYPTHMGWDRRVLPPDRDREETFPWMGLLAIVLIVVGLLVVLWLVFGVLGDDTPAEGLLSLWAI